MIRNYLPRRLAIKLFPNTPYKQDVICSRCWYVTQHWLLKNERVHFANGHNYLNIIITDWIMSVISLRLFLPTPKPTAHIHRDLFYYSISYTIYTNRKYEYELGNIGKRIVFLIYNSAIIIRVPFVIERAVKMR